MRTVISEGIRWCFITTFFISCFKGTENVSIISIWSCLVMFFRKKLFCLLCLGSVGQCLFCFCPQNKKESVGSGLNLGSVGLRQITIFLGLVDRTGSNKRVSVQDGWFNKLLTLFERQICESGKNWYTFMYTLVLYRSHWPLTLCYEALLAHIVSYFWVSLTEKEKLPKLALNIHVYQYCFKSSCSRIWNVWQIFLLRSLSTYWKVKWKHKWNMLINQLYWLLTLREIVCFEKKQPVTDSDKQVWRAWRYVIHYVCF